MEIDNLIAIDMHTHLERHEAVIHCTQLRAFLP